MKSGAKMHRVFHLVASASSPKLVRKSMACGQEVGMKRFASLPGGTATRLSGLQRAPRHQFGVPLSGTAADGRQRSRPRSESLQRFAEATIALRTRRAKEANRVDSSLATAAVCCKAGNATGCRNLMASTCIVDEAVVRTCGGIMKPETGMQLGIAHAAAHSFSMGSSCLRVNA